MSKSDEAVSVTVSESSKKFAQKYTERRGFSSLREGLDKLLGIAESRLGATTRHAEKNKAKKPAKAKKEPKAKVVKAKPAKKVPEKKAKAPARPRAKKAPSAPVASPEQLQAQPAAEQQAVA